MNQLSYSDAGLALTKQYEGLRLNAYKDAAGVMTIGYGHTGSDVTPGYSITEERATELLLQDVQFAVDTVNRVVKVPLNQNQFDALVDFVFNAGSHAFVTSTMLRYINLGNMIAARMQFERWVYADGKELVGLVRRRAAEAALFGL